MATQDRNVSRDAQIARKAANAPIVALAAVDNDEPIYAAQPRYNYRIADLSAYARTVATAAVNVRAKAVQDNGVAGQPLFAAAAAVTFAIEAFWQNLVGVLTARAATAAQAFSGTETVLAELWGVWLVVVDAAGTITTRGASSTMGYPTEEDALRACPQVAGDGSEGVVGILTLATTGAPFIAGTTDTNDALVTDFNTYDAGGHDVALPIDTDPQTVNAALAQAISDPSGMRILSGRGDTDLLVVTGRSAGAAVVTEGTFQCEYRPAPIAGEGRGNESVSQTQAQFVP